MSDSTLWTIYKYQAEQKRHVWKSAGNPCRLVDSHFFFLLFIQASLESSIPLVCSLTPSLFLSRSWCAFTLISCAAFSSKFFICRNISRYCFVSFASSYNSYDNHHYFFFSQLCFIDFNADLFGNLPSKAVWSYTSYDSRIQTHSFDRKILH